MTSCEVLRAAKQLSYVYEGEPAQVEQYCPLVWNPRILEILVIARIREALHAVEAAGDFAALRRSRETKRSVRASRKLRTLPGRRPSCR